MREAGAEEVADFAMLCHPSTCVLDAADLLEIFHRLDARCGRDPDGFWVVELADGVLQRETARLLEARQVRGRMHRLFLSASDALDAIGGLSVLRDRFHVVPDAVSGCISSSPLAIRELQGEVDIPAFANRCPDHERGRINALLA